MTKLEKYFPHLWIIILALIAIYIRVNGANYYHYSEDESMHFGIASAKSLLQVLQFSLYETHPPILYILLHYWLIISDQIWFVRCLSLIFGIALIPLYYFIGKKINGELTGVCAATLIAFSHGAIIQSYQVRHYAIFTFFISLAYYFYLLWKEEFKSKQIIGYLLFSTLACFTHFSAIFFVFIIASYQTIIFYKKDKKRLLIWGIINLLIASVFIITYKVWQQTFSFSSLYEDAPYYKIIVGGLFYPLFTSLHLLPNHTILILVTIFVPLCLKNNKNLLSLFIIFCLSSLLGSILVFIRIYRLETLRHHLWIMPFIIPFSACVIADSFSLILTELKIPHINKLVLLLLFTISMLGYDKEERFASVEEYMVSENNWQEIDKYLNTIDNHSLLLAERDDAIMLTNIYPYLGKEQFEKTAMTSWLNYKNTNIVFNPYYRRISYKFMFLETTTELYNTIPNNIDNIIIMNTKWTGAQARNSSFPLLILCPELDKKITYFPASRQGEKITKENIYDFDALFMTVSKKDLFEQVIAENGKAHYCLDQKLKDD